MQRQPAMPAGGMQLFSSGSGRDAGSAMNKDEHGQRRQTAPATATLMPKTRVPKVPRHRD